MVVILCLLSFMSFSEDLSLPEKKIEKQNWSVGLSHALSIGAYHEAKATASHSLSFSYKYKDYNLSVKSSYLQSSGFVSDPSYFGLTDISLGASRSLKSLKGFLGFNWNAFLGVTLPTSKISWRKGKYLSFFGNVSYQKRFKNIFSLSLSHILYSDFHKYRSNISGHSNRLASSSHEVQLSMKIKKITVSGSGTFYLYTYLTDLNPDPIILETLLKFKAYQGGSLNLSYLIWTKHNLRAGAGWSINIPVVSSVLTGFPGFDKRYWRYNFGLSWSI